MKSGPWRSPSSSILLASLFALGLGCSTDSDDSDMGAEGAEGGDGDGDGDWEPIPARGDINLSSVVVNQGVDVAIAVSGEWVGPADRNSFVVSNRDTLLRGFWEIPEDWVVRPIRAQLELRYPDGTTDVFSDTKVIDGPAYAGDIDRGFFFPLVADQFPPGVEYHMTLWEAEEGHEDQRESTTIIESPIGGLAEIGIQPEPAEMRVVLVPVRYSTANCNTNTAELTEEQEQTFLDYLHEQNPVQQVIWEFRRDAPIEWSTTLTSLAELWEPLQEMRIADGAPPNAYYYALVDACTGGIDGAGGIAPGLAPATKEAAYMRVSSGLWNDVAYSYHTFVHEVGHNQGRAHIFCENGDAAGVDPSYPYEGGIIGVWGFGIRLFRFHSPTASYDYMSYCSPSWVSDWTWSKTFSRIRTLTAWDYEGAEADPTPQGEVLIGLLLNDGSERWWTTQGGREPEYFGGAQTIAFEYEGEIIQQPAAIEHLDDGGVMITAPVPRPRVTIDAAVRYADGQAHPIDLQPDAVKSWTF
ncbi:MAG TPA: hypothetical protein VM869_30085 [Enhygromyxa sp.]|nr:hypothetical protein [Enhygromyxa sp.]